MYYAAGHSVTMRLNPNQFQFSVSSLNARRFSAKSESGIGSQVDLGISRLC